MLGRGHRLGLGDVGPAHVRLGWLSYGQSAPCLGLTFPICEMRGLLMLSQALYLNNSPVQVESRYKGVCIIVCVAPKALMYKRVCVWGGAVYS